MKKLIYTIPIITVLLASSGCNGFMKNNSATQFLYGALMNTPPVLSPLQVTPGDTTIVLYQPTFVFVGNPPVTNPGGLVEAYIGPDGGMTYDNITQTVTGTIIAGPIDVSGSNHTFGALPEAPLDANTNYRIIVVASSSSGISVKQSAVLTGGTTPVLPTLQITSVTNTSIALAQPIPIVSGIPAAAITAYIGVNGSIFVDLITGVVSGTIVDTQDVTSSSCTFTPLTVDTDYRIIVVADSGSAGFDARQIVVRTGVTAPVMNALTLTAVTNTTIQLDAPVLSPAGDPPPTVEAYIGPESAISWAPATGVTGTIISGPIDVSVAGHTFGALPEAPLTVDTQYRIIVVATNSAGLDVRQIVVKTGDTAPVMNPLALTAVTNTSIDLTQPTFSATGVPAPTVQAWIGPASGAGAITWDPVAGITNSTQGPFNVAASGHNFTPLTVDTQYRIIVVATSSSGLDVRQLAVKTGDTAPVMDPLTISAVTNTSIALVQPTFTTTGVPAPTVQAWIGPASGAGAITWDPVAGITNSTQGPFDVSAGGHNFTPLTVDTQYRIIVVATSSSGLDVRQLAVKTGDTAPVMDPLTISAVTNTSITLVEPTFTTTGSPAPTVRAWIGPASGAGAITWDPVAGVTNSTQGPFIVVPGGHNFTPLTVDTQYKIIVVATSNSGLDVRQIVVKTGDTAPVMDPLTISAATNTSITLVQPTFTTTGVPAPTVQAWIGPASGAGAITWDPVAGITNSTQGPTNVSAGGWNIVGLTVDTQYKIIVVATSSSGLDVRQLVVKTGDTAPVMDPLTISAATNTSITLVQPTFTTTGVPAPTVQAWIGPASGAGAITWDPVAGITNSTQGPFNVAAGGHNFTPLTVDTQYKIIVVATSSSGLDVRQLVVKTGDTAPVMDPLTLTAVTNTSINLTQPTFTTTGVPAPTVQAWIGPASGAGAITWDPVAGITNSTQGPFNVAAGGHNFTPLTVDTQYKIIVVATSSSGLDVRQLVVKTGDTAPVMNALALTAVTNTSINLTQPTFSTTGVPAPTVQAWIGPASGAGAITWDPVAGITNSTQGPFNVAAGGHNFTPLTVDTQYKIIVVATSSSGLDVRQLVVKTGDTAPVMDPLTISAATNTSITLVQPTFTTTGVPAPTVQAWIGPASGAGAITWDPVAGITNSTQGPTDVSAGGWNIVGLTVDTQYKIIVVATSSSGLDVRQLVVKTGDTAPVMNALALTAVTNTSINLTQPTFTTTGVPAPTVQAWIGPASGAGAITWDPVAGITNSTQGPFNVAAGGHNFTPLTVDTQYKIIVVATSSSGLDVRQLVVKTGDTAPVMDPLTISAVTNTSITLVQPTFTTTGVPAPTVQAWIGPASGAGAITWDPVAGITNSTQGPTNVSAGGWNIVGLTVDTQYKIIVVATSSSGLDLRQLVVKTGDTAPVMNALSITSVSDTAIVLAQPTFSTTGVPAPTVRAWIGQSSSIAWSVATGVTGFSQGPTDVSAGGWNITGLTGDTYYTIIVVAQSSSGLAVRQMAVNTMCVPPIMNNLTLTPGGAGTALITLTQPTFSTTGVPAPSVQAWIGRDGTIGITGTTVTGSLEGPINVSASSYVFGSVVTLTSGLDYRVIVVAQSSCGYSAKQAVATAP